MELKELFEKLGLDRDVLEIPKTKKIFSEAFTHRSAVNERSSADRHNERLEFLGDAVLELVTTEFLFHTFPEKPEGDLTNLRSALVKKENLAKVARKINLGAYLRLSKGEEKSGGREKDYLLANLVEALLGGLYLVFGGEVSQEFIEEYVLSELDDILKHDLHLDAKSQFQEFTQGELGITPQYRLISDSGKDHEKTFVLGAFLNETCVGEGKGGSKKEAQISAAAVALATKDQWESQFPRKST